MGGADSEKKYHLYLSLAKRKFWSKSKKTKLWFVRKDSHKELAECLGVIKWHGAWRQYVFIPENNTIWDKNCLSKVWDFLDDVNYEHREKLRKKRSGAKSG